ncbi:fluoride efflux transporter FluC [Leucobacter sp. USHLN153]|uniref:fluoride efflux transporter FluC n=1 Tax=Leucobacter sp. USHLN153 TaxID=3081268 RepID=UPI00301AB4FD
MNALTVVVVALAGGVGSALRYLVDNAVPARVRARFPWGTALVNLTGSFALGIVTGLMSRGAPTLWGEAVAIGVLGGYTTFSTASIETVRLALDRRAWSAALNGVGILIACVALALVGYVAAA